MDISIHEAPFGSLGHDPGLRLRMRGEERRINDQHEKLDGLCREVYARLEKEGTTAATPSFRLFARALDAHMTVEEEVHFPAVHGLRPDTAEELGDLVEEHASLRLAADWVKRRLVAGDAEGARVALVELARAITRHEQVEEDLLARINEGPGFERSVAAL